MGFIQLLASLWPFLKEMFIGEKINDPNASRQGNTDRSQPRVKYPVLAARWVMTKMQSSRRFLATVITILILSLFVNYRVINKLSAVAPRDEKQVHATTPQSQELKETPTVPRKDKTEKEILFEQTVRELKNLYGEVP